MGKDAKRVFFRDIWTSIKDFEKYEEFAADDILKSTKYILLIIMLFTIIITSAFTYKLCLIVQDVREYIDQNIEEISFVNGKLDIKSNETIVIENDKQVIPIIIIDTSKDVDEQMLLDRINPYDNGLIILSDRIVISSKLLNGTQSVLYSNILNENIGDKGEVLKLTTFEKMVFTYITFFITVFIYLFVIYLFSSLVDGIVLGVIGNIFGRIVRLRLKYSATFNIGLHALTLPLILKLVYIIVNTFIGFEIEYFGWMYTTISYIYVAVAILMIKAEIINQKIQLTKVEKIQEKPIEEPVENPDEQNKEKEEKPEEDKKDENEKNNGGEPEANNA